MNTENSKCLFVILDETRRMIPIYNYEYAA